MNTDNTQRLTVKNLIDSLLMEISKDYSILDKNAVVFANGDVFPILAVQPIEEGSSGLELGCGWSPLDEDEI